MIFSLAVHDTVVLPIFRCNQVQSLSKNRNNGISKSWKRKKYLSSPPLSFSCRMPTYNNIRILHATTPKYFEKCLEVRQEVFINEQKHSIAIERDGYK